MDQPSAGHDVIVIGASAGGYEALNMILGGLPADLPASILIVLHVGATSHLAQLLNGASKLPVKSAESGETIKRGIVYVAGPGAHLLIHDSHILLRRGPRENFARPAADPLFRSAAITFGGRVIGVILSGGLNDGTAGLLAIKRCGGLTVVQGPADAAVDDMPRSALRHVTVDHVCSAAEMAKLLARLTLEPAGRTHPAPFTMRLETAIAAQEPTSMEIEDKLGKTSPFTCPECHGALWEIEDDSMLRYRCHIGHAFTAETVLSGYAEEIERMASNLLRSQQERAAFVRRMAGQERALQREDLARQLELRAKEYDEGASLLRKLIQSIGEQPDAGVERKGAMPANDVEEGEESQ
jgi:two-component system chemotaxis response regulator CheB